jgi:2-amino-4-hydroxy-6-hydroxymethyldihydropteridine diphosphokinase
MRVHLGLGSNLGDRRENLARAVELLARVPCVAVVARSSIWESAPMGPPQPDFLNAVVTVATGLTPRLLFQTCKAIERELGRQPGPRWGPRLVDIDLLLGEEVVDEPDLKIPHAELHRRAFALAPLCELDAEAVHPLLGKSLRELLLALGDQVIRRVGAL